MATYRKRKGGYEIRVSAGYDSTGKQIMRQFTWHPGNLTPKQEEKELQRQIVAFEKKVKQGYVIDEKMTFEKYADYVIKLKQRTGAKHRTIERYTALLVRINPAIGFMKLDEIRPAHLNSFYTELLKPKTERQASAKIDLQALIKARKIALLTISKACGISASTLRGAYSKPVTMETAGGWATALGGKVTDYFKVAESQAVLSNKTVLEYHRLISTIMEQAEKEMLIPYNPAHRATPPKLIKKDPNYFQPETVGAIREALELEPLKWKTATHLLLLSGCRRGEILGLKWAKVNFKSCTIIIDNALLYSADIGIYEDTPKTKTSVRSIKLPAETMDLLAAWKREQTRQRIASGDIWTYTDFVFTKDNGQPMHPDSLTDWLGKFSRRHDLPHINPHAFRHTMASLLYFNGVDSVTISKRLGHSKVSTTSDIYAHVIKQADEQAADCLGDIILHRHVSAG